MRDQELRAQHLTRSTASGTSEHMTEPEPTPQRRQGPAVADADVCGPLDRPRSPTRCTGATSPRARPACRSPSTCRPRPATTRTTCSPAARSARSACRSRTWATCARCSTDIPLEQMNTSMTINATAMWLLALYQVVAEEQGADSPSSRHDAERHRQGVPVARHVRLSAGPSLRLTTDMIAYTVAPHAEVEPDQHLQLPPAGGRRDARSRRSPTRCPRRSPYWTRSATPDRCRRSDAARWSAGSRSSSTPGVRFVEEMCKMRAFVRLWDELTRERYGVDRRQAAPVPLRRAGQLARADRGAAGEQRPADRAGDARPSPCPRTPAPAPSSCPPGTRPSVCPGPGTSSGRCASSRSSRYESDLLEYDDIFDGSHVVEAKVAELVARRRGGDRPGAGDGRCGRRPSSPAT